MRGLDARRRERESFVEPAVNMPVYVAGVASVAVADGLLNMSYYVDMPTPGGTEHAICLRVIMPLLALLPSRTKVNEALKKANVRLDG